MNLGLASAHHVVCAIALAIAVTERIEARIEGLIAGPIAPNPTHLTLQSFPCQASGLEEGVDSRKGGLCPTGETALSTWQLSSLSCQNKHADMLQSACMLIAETSKVHFTSVPESTCAFTGLEKL